MLLHGFPNYAEVVVDKTLRRDSLLELDTDIAQLLCCHKERREEHFVHAAFFLLLDNFLKYMTGSWWLDQREWTRPVAKLLCIGGQGIYFVTTVCREWVLNSEWKNTDKR